MLNSPKKNGKPVRTNKFLVVTRPELSDEAHPRVEMILSKQRTYTLLGRASSRIFCGDGINVGAHGRGVGRVSEGSEPINYELIGHTGPIVRHTIRE